MSRNYEKNVYSFLEKGLFSNMSKDNYLRDEEIYTFLPFSDLCGWIYSDDKFWEVKEAFDEKFQRLEDIRCLSYLAPMNLNRNIEDQILFPFSHNRDNHTYVVAGTGVRILTRNCSSESDINKFVIASFLHDLATPALGDATKYIDVKNLHEEMFWREMLDDNSLQYINNLKVSVDEIGSIIKNDGLLGEVLDIADRITYVCQDLRMNTPFYFFDKPKSKKDVENILMYFDYCHPNIGNIYKDIKIENNEVYFSNPERLYQFLRLRIMLFEQVYMNPINQGRDFYVASKIKPFYTSNNNNTELLTPNKLRNMNDLQLIAFLAKKYNQPVREFDDKVMRWHPQYFQKFKSLEDAKNKEIELKSIPSINIIGIKECVGCSSSTKYKVKGEDGKIKPFFEYYPVKAEELNKKAAEIKGFVLYYENKLRHNLD